MFEIAELLTEYDQARAYTDELWRDLTIDELHWRPTENFSPIGWHLGHQAHVAHFMYQSRNGIAVKSLETGYACCSFHVPVVTCHCWSAPE